MRQRSAGTSDKVCGSSSGNEDSCTAECVGRSQRSNFRISRIRGDRATSGGIANSHGYPEPQRISSVEMVATVRQIAQAVTLPVSADIAAGYGGSLAAIADTVKATIEAGAVGINLEDSPGLSGSPLMEIGAQQDRLRTIREIAAKAGVPIG
jgi:2-methylisocitrate lyase-like PEP mutase family enzyme